ncbi:MULTISPECIES: hypothetical protein [Thermodesulfovibrio]|jgi:general stress protein CsbA|uniref:hypothetical protein n=1 Tax=Thermodesulfovibrio TaxID=28261 RepID=UPI00260267F3|nr:hypothetical protein [Thermodesulfovibrio sp.]
MRKIIVFLRQFGIVVYEFLASILFAITVFLTFATETKKRFLFFFVVGVLIFSYLAGGVIIKDTQYSICHEKAFSSDDKKFLLRVPLFDRHIPVDKSCLEHIYAYAYFQKYVAADKFKDPRRSEMYQIQYDALMKDIYEKENNYIEQQNESVFKKVSRRIILGLFALPLPLLPFYESIFGR